MCHYVRMCVLATIHAVSYTITHCMMSVFTMSIYQVSKTVILPYRAQFHVTHLYKFKTTQAYVRMYCRARMFGVANVWQIAG